MLVVVDADQPRAPLIVFGQFTNDPLRNEHSLLRCLFVIRCCRPGRSKSDQHRPCSGSDIATSFSPFTRLFCNLDGENPPTPRSGPEFLSSGYPECPRNPRCPQARPVAATQSPRGGVTRDRRTALHIIRLPLDGVLNSRVPAAVPTERPDGRRPLVKVSVSSATLRLDLAHPWLPGPRLRSHYHADWRAVALLLRAICLIPLSSQSAVLQTPSWERGG